MSLDYFKVIVCLSVALVTVSAVNAEGTRKNIRFVEYPEFPDAHSTWKSIGYSRQHDKIYIGVTNHVDRVGLYEYDPAQNKMRLVGFLDQMLNLREWQWQGKIHSEIIEGEDGRMYFSTDGGESREEYFMNHPEGYAGGIFGCYDPGTGVMYNLGKAFQYDSIKDIALGPGSLIYAVSYPQVHFLVYDWKKNALRDMGRVGSSHVPRHIFSDRWGNGYYVDWRQRLVKYEPHNDRLLFAQDSIPSWPGTDPGIIITGVPTIAASMDSSQIYMITYGNMICRFTPQRDGIGKVEPLGPTWDTPERPPRGYSPNLAVAENDKLYYFIGGHGKYVIKDTTLLVEFDPEKRTRQALLKFHISDISEVTGASVRDHRGNLYFAGRKHDAEAAEMGESGASRPFMIVFNPLKELQ